MLPTPEQTAVLEAVSSRTENIAIAAVAGSGKTTTVVQACHVAGPRTGFLAFNVHIADELKRRLRGSAEAMTLHGLGFRALGRKSPSIELDRNKSKRLLLKLFPKLHREGRGKWAGRFFLKDEFIGLPDAMSVCKQRNLLPSEDPDGTKQACLSQDVELPRNPSTREEFWSATESGLNESCEDLATCDYDDMVWLPVRLNLVRSDYSSLFVDEAQDLNPTQQQLALRSGDRISIVGDPFQAIMGFAGADTKSFSRLCERLAKSERKLLRFPLTSCFRCPTSHLELARLLVPHIEPGAFADEGETEEKTPAELVAGVVPGDMVLCRNTAPVIRMAYRLLAARIPALVRGRKIGENLKSLLKELNPSDNAALAKCVTIWRDEQREKLEAVDAPEDAIEAMVDRAESLLALAISTSTLGELTALLDSLFSDTADPADKVLLSTVHRAKGLEANRVWLYEPGLMPGGNPRAGGSRQELNLLYVALTRAKESLFFCDDVIRRHSQFHEWVADVAAGYCRFDLTAKPERKDP